MVTSPTSTSYEHQHLKSARKHALQIVDINTTLASIHTQLASQITPNTYLAATTYVNQYIIHADIWQVKFIRNFENPEVALMQIFHLTYILQHEPEHNFIEERALLEQQRIKFEAITMYSTTLIEIRQLKMLDYIQNFTS